GGGRGGPGSGPARGCRFTRSRGPGRRLWRNLADAEAAQPLLDRLSATAASNSRSENELGRAAWSHSASSDIRLDPGFIRAKTPPGDAAVHEPRSALRGTVHYSSGEWVRGACRTGFEPPRPIG